MNKKSENYFRTVEQKLGILVYAEQYGQDKAVLAYGCSRSVIYDWKKQEAHLHTSFPVV